MVRTLACLSALFLPVTGLTQGKLDRAREAVDRPRDPDKPSDSTTPDDTSGSGTPSSGDDEESDVFGELFLLVATTPWSVPHAIFDPGLKYDSKFTAYPYAAADTGHVLIDRWYLPHADGPRFPDRTDTQWYSARASAEVGSDFDGLTRVGLRLFLDTDTRFGLKSDWDCYTERLPCGCWDHLWLGDLTATYRFAQCETVQMHTGLGARFLLDDGHDRGGVNFLYGFDAFPVEPVHLFGSFEAGTLGNAGVWRVHGGAGANWTHAELFAGYDYLSIGGVILQGPFVGLRLWF